MLTINHLNIINDNSVSIKQQQQLDRLLNITQKDKNNYLYY